jgi:Protein of unknown function (DUF2934)
MHSPSQPPDQSLAIQQLAYTYWEARGRLCGSPEEDWFRAEQKIQQREARAERLIRYSIRMMSGLGYIAKALLLLLGIVLITFVGVWMTVWIVGAHSLTIHGMLDLLQRLIAPLVKTLLLVLLMMLATAFVKVIGVWIIRGYRLMVHGALDLLPRLTAPLGKALLLVLLIVSGTALVGVVGSWTVGGDTITIASFTDMRAEASQKKNMELGHTITDALTSQIHRINQLHTLRNPWGSADEASTLEMTGPQAYERVGTVSFAGVELPVGEVVLALRALWPSWYTRYVITGSLQNCLSGRPTCAQLSVHLEEDGQTRKFWSYKLLLDNEHTVDEQIQELAYQIMWSTLDGIEGNSLESFKNLIEGVALFRQYKNKQSFDDFVKAESYLLKSVDIDKKYARAHFYLGNLYNWRAYFADIESKDERDYREKAINRYKEAGHGYTANIYEAESFMNFGIGLVYHRAYSKVKKKYKEHVSDKILDLNQFLAKAHEYYTKVTDQDQDFYFAKTGRELIYKEKAYLGGFNRINNPEVYMHCAIQELRHAKYIAEDRKDKESLRWLDRNLHELERNLHERQSSRTRLQAAWSWIPALKNKCLESDGVPSENASPTPLAQRKRP